jgi:hypothetical protein
MKKRDVVIIFLLIAFGFFYQAIEKGKIRFMHDFSYYSDERKLMGSQFVEFAEKEKIFPAVSHIVVENPAGEITIHKSVDDQVHLLSFFRVYYSEKSDVNEIQNKTRIKTELQNNELKISGQYLSAFPYRRLRIHLQLTVPRGVTLSLANQEGDIVVRDTGKDLSLNQENGNLILENVPSGMQMVLKNGNANIKNIAGPVDISASRADVFLENVLSLRLQASHGDCSLAKIKNSATIDHAFGKLVVIDSAKVEITARQSNVFAKNINAGLTVSDKYENIVLENISGDIQISGRSSKIGLSHVLGRNVVIESSFADVSIADYSGDNLDILLKNGNLDLQVKKAANRINIESKNAELNLSFGPMPDPTFNLKARQGRIIADPAFDLEKFEENADSFANRVGQKPEILVNNTYGDIYLKTLFK